MTHLLNCWDGALRKTLEEERSVRDMELALLARNGEILHTITSIETIEFQGEPHVVATFVDITGRKRTEEALRESEATFAAAFEHAPIGKAIVAPDGSFLRVNRVLCEIVGCTEAEMLTLTFQDITHAEDLDLDLANVQKMLRHEIETYQMEKRYLHKGGGSGVGATQCLHGE
jgi:PAS domain S-box-containing protein